MVHDFVEEREGLSMLRDKRLVAATVDVSGISLSKQEVSETTASEIVRSGLGDCLCLGHVADGDTSIPLQHTLPKSRRSFMLAPMEPLL